MQDGSFTSSFIRGHQAGVQDREIVSQKLREQALLEREQIKMQNAIRERFSQARLQFEPEGYVGWDEAQVYLDENPQDIGGALQKIRQTSVPEEILRTAGDEIKNILGSEEGRTKYNISSDYSPDSKLTEAALNELPLTQMNIDDVEDVYTAMLERGANQRTLKYVSDIYEIKKEKEKRGADVDIDNLRKRSLELDNRYKQLRIDALNATKDSPIEHKGLTPKQLLDSLEDERNRIAGATEAYIEIAQGGDMDIDGGIALGQILRENGITGDESFDSLSPEQQAQARIRAKQLIQENEVKIRDIANRMELIRQNTRESFIKATEGWNVDKKKVEVTETVEEEDVDPDLETTKEEQPSIDKDIDDIIKLLEEDIKASEEDVSRETKEKKEESEDKSGDTTKFIGKM